MRLAAIALLLVCCAPRSPASQPIVSIVAVDESLTGARCSVEASRIIADNHSQDIAAWEMALIKCDAREQIAISRSDAAMRALEARSFWADYGAIIAVGAGVIGGSLGLVLGYAIGSKLNQGNDLTIRTDQPTRSP